MQSWLRQFHNTLEHCQQAGTLRSRWMLHDSRIEQDIDSTSQRPLRSSILHFGSNDYLSIRNHSRLRLAAESAMQEVGVGSGASPLIGGYSSWHQHLERQLADWSNAEAALLFTSGYAANIGVVSALAGANDLILSDRLNHASLIDGCRLSKATSVVYPHGDSGFVRDYLKEHRHRFQKVLLLTESVFSMDGDVAPLADLTALANEYDCGLIVDEAHACGIFGENGAGCSESTGLSNQWLAKLGTLSKAIGSCGGYVAGSQLLVDYLLNTSRSYMFSTSMPAAIAAASIAGIELAQELSAERQVLFANSIYLREQLRKQGWLVPAGNTPIIPVIVGEARLATTIHAELLREDIFVPAIRPPTVPTNTSRLRISLTLSHSKEQLEKLLAAMQKLRRYFNTPTS